MDGLIDVQLQIFPGDNRESVAADVLNNGIMSCTVQSALDRGLDADVTAVALSAVVGFASGNGENGIAKCPVGSFYHIGSDVFEQLWLLIGNGDNKVYYKSLSPERYNFVIRKYPFGQQSMPVGIYFKNPGFKLKLFGI